MKTSIENVAKIIASAIWADGVFDEAEKVTVEEIAEALELDEQAFFAAVNKEVTALEGMSDNMANAVLQDAAEAVDDEEIGEIFECAMQMLLADSELTRSEVSNLFVIAEALGIEQEDAVLMLADMVQDEEDLTINMAE